MIDKSCVLAKIVDKNPGAVSKIVLRACKEWSSNDSSLTNRSFVLDIKIDSFSIPGDDGFGFEEFFDTVETLVTIGNDGSAGDDNLWIILFNWIRLLTALLIDLFKLFNSSVLKLACILFIEPIVGWAAHAICNPKYLIIRVCGGLLGKEVFCIKAVEFEHLVLAFMSGEVDLWDLCYKSLLDNAKGCLVWTKLKNKGLFWKIIWC
jgi:hypothetical protein